MGDRKKLDRWAEKLLDTGKRNNLINFKDTKTSTAEIIYPECETVFSKCSVGRIYPGDEQGIKNRCRLSDIPKNVKYEVAPPRMASNQRFIWQKTS